ncbi:MAG: hypothetical protein ABIY70_06500 [Capsulimonas sp.]|uniref:hypothetical protein n=1 Tax=Capsulimonas sp. TaxID=2494211 RepID=UPI0032643146
MADWHLKELDEALSAKGWRIVAHHPGDDYNVSASWEVQRSTRFPSVFIDFDGFDDMVCLPLEKAIGCDIRDLPTPSLYFRSRNAKWSEELRAFVKALDASENLFTLFYDLDDNGWAKAALYPKPENPIYGFDGTYRGDSLEDLARRVIEVIRNPAPIKVTSTWLELPWTARWTLKKNGDNVTIRIFLFPDYDQEIEDETGELFFEMECSLIRLATQVEGQLQKILREYGETGYKARCKDDFPTETLTELSQMIADYQKGDI